MHPLPTESDPLLLAIGLQILGRMQSRKVAVMERQHLTHEVALVRSAFRF